jgi:hypothetical protein
MRGVAIAAVVGALAAVGCGSDDTKDAVQQVKDQGSQLRDDIRSGASADEIQAKLDKLQSDAQGKGEDAKKEAEKLRKQLRRELKEKLP